MANVPFRLRFPESEIPYWADRYDSKVDQEIMEAVGPAVKRRGYLRQEDIMTIGVWKSPRIRSRLRGNPAPRVEEVSRTALAATDERIKIGALQVLDGVGWPTASVVLHFCDRGPYPVLDVRALWSLGYERQPSYGYGFWDAYVEFTRDLAERTSHSMRVIDRALWQYSKENQNG